MPVGWAVGYKENHYVGHISLIAMKKLEVSPRFELRSLVSESRVLTRRSKGEE